MDGNKCISKEFVSEMVQRRMLGTCPSEEDGYVPMVNDFCHVLPFSVEWVISEAPGTSES